MVYMIKVKEWYKSNTLQIAILQAIAGILVAILADFPELQSVGGILVIKSAIDFLIRFKTNQPIK